MPRYKMITLTRPVPGREGDYNHWYQDVHLPQVMGIPGLVEAQRFHVERVMAGDDGLPYAAIYEIETDDIDAVLGAINAGMTSGELTMTDAVDASHSLALVVTACGEVVTA